MGKVLSDCWKIGLKGNQGDRKGANIGWSLVRKEKFPNFVSNVSTFFAV